MRRQRLLRRQRPQKLLKRKGPRATRQRRLSSTRQAAWSKKTKPMEQQSRKRQSSTHKAKRSCILDQKRQKSPRWMEKLWRAQKPRRQQMMVKHQKLTQRKEAGLRKSRPQRGKHPWRPRTEWGRINSTSWSTCCKNNKKSDSVLNACLDYIKALLHTWIHLCLMKLLCLCSNCVKRDCNMAACWWLDSQTMLLLKLELSFFLFLYTDSMLSIILWEINLLRTFNTDLWIIHTQKRHLTQRMKQCCVQTYQIILKKLVVKNLF